MSETAAAPSSASTTSSSKASKPAKREKRSESRAMEIGAPKQASPRFRGRVHSWEAWDLDRFPWEQEFGEAPTEHQNDIRPLFSASTIRARIAAIQEPYVEQLRQQIQQEEKREEIESWKQPGLDQTSQIIDLLDTTRSVRSRSFDSGPLTLVETASRTSSARDPVNYDVYDWYAQIDEGVRELWMLLPSSTIVHKGLPNVIDLRAPWQDLARTRAMTNITIVRRRGGKGSGGMSVMGIKLARIVGELLFTLQRSHRARLHILHALAQKDRSSIARVANCLVQSILHPVAISDGVLLEWLAHLLVAVSSGALGKGTLWNVLTAIASREDCGLGGALGPHSCEHESLKWTPSDWALHAPVPIRRVAQLVAATAKETGITVEHFLVEAWLVPRLVAIGRDQDAANVSREGLPSGIVRAILKSKLPAPDRCDRGELCGLVTLRGEEVIALMHATLLASETTFTESIDTPPNESGVSAIAHLRVCAEKLRNIDVSPVKAHEWYAIPLQDFRAHHLTQCDADKVAWICLRIQSLHNLMMRIEETLAREALLQDSPPALHTRCLEMSAIVDELNSCRGEASMIWNFVDQIKGNLAYLRRRERSMSATAIDEPDEPDEVEETEETSEPAVQAREESEESEEPEESEEDSTLSETSVEEVDDVESHRSAELDETPDSFAIRKAITAIKQPCPMLEIVYQGKSSMPPRSCIYELSQDETQIYITSEVDYNLEETFGIEAIRRIEMGISSISPSSAGIGHSGASLGCCLFMTLQDNITLQLVAPSAIQALLWTFGIQQVGASCAKTMTPIHFRKLLDEYARRRDQLD